MKLKIAIALVFALLVSGCGADEEAATTTTVKEPLRYVAIGASESVGEGADDPATQAWPVVLHKTSMPADTVLTNLGVSGSTLSQAMNAQLPKALEAKPDIVTIWLNVNDLVTGVPIETYEKNLLDMVSQLRANGAKQILIANTPPVEDLPLYQQLRNSPPAGLLQAGGFTIPGPEVINAQVGAYNDAIARVVKETGSTEVDLFTAFGERNAAGTAAELISGDGFHPSTEGYAFIAEQFAGALDLPN